MSWNGDPFGLSGWSDRPFLTAGAQRPPCEPGAVRGRVCDRRGRVRLLSGYIPGIAGERFPELAATLDHLDRCDAQMAVLTVGPRTEDTGLGQG